MEVGEVERAALELITRGRLDGTQPISAVALARRLLGTGSVRTIDERALPGDGAIARVNASWRIYVRPALTPQRLNFVVAHELAHWYLGAAAGGLELERLCDALAAALVAPREAFLRALRETPRFPALARRFATSETCVALRLGETTGLALAVIAPRVVRTRGTGFVWPPESELRELAKKRCVPGLRKAQLRDDPRRVALVTRSG